MAYVSGTFGPHAWPIPVTAIPFPESDDRFKWFAYFLILGQVDTRFADFNSQLISHPRILFKPWIRLQPALLSIVQELRLKRVSCLRELRREWHHDPKCEFLPLLDMILMIRPQICCLKWRTGSRSHNTRICLRCFIQRNNKTENSKFNFY